MQCKRRAREGAREKNLPKNAKKTTPQPTLMQTTRIAVTSRGERARESGSAAFGALSMPPVLHAQPPPPAATVALSKPAVPPAPFFGKFFFFPFGNCNRIGCVARCAQHTIVAVRVLSLSRSRFLLFARARSRGEFGEYAFTLRSGYTSSVCFAVLFAYACLLT